MKIFYITNARIPTEKAHGLQIVKMCEAYGRAGHDVTLFVPTRKNKIAEDVYEYYDAVHSFKVIYIKTFDFMRYAKWLRGFAYYLQSFFFLIKITSIKNTENAVIMTRIPVIAWAYNLFGRKVVCEVHNWPSSRKGRFMATFLLRKVDFIVCNSEGTQQEFLNKHIQASVMQNAVDVEQFDLDVDKELVKISLGIPLDKKIVMYIGALEAWKGVETLLEAAKLLSEKIQVVIIGGSDQQVEIFKLKYPQVLFLGYRPYAELPKNQKTADILVIPNSPNSVESAKYTSPIKVFAHLMSGVPILVSKLPSLERIIDSTEVYFFKPGNETHLAERVVHILANPVESQKKSGRACVKGVGFSWQKRALEIINHIQ